MADDDDDDLDLEGVRYWAGVMTSRHGHATLDAKPGNNDIEGRQIVERGVAQEFCDVMERLHSIRITGVRSNPHDPPDCLAATNGQLFGIECGELVKGDLIGDLRRRHAAGSPMPAGERFDRAQWSPQLLADCIERILADKDSKYAKRGLVFDALVIHTRETWLLPEYVERWLPAIKITPRTSIRNAYLLGRYNPDPEGEGNGHRPLYRLYGPLWS